MLLQTGNYPAGAYTLCAFDTYFTFVGTAPAPLLTQLLGSLTFTVD